MDAGCQKSFNKKTPKKQNPRKSGVLLFSFEVSSGFEPL